MISDSGDTNYFIPARAAYPGNSNQIVAESGWEFTKAGLNKTDSGAWGTIPRGLETFKITIRGTINPLPGVTVSESSLMLYEGDTDTYDVVLDLEPSDTVTITVASDDTDDVTVSPATLTFTTTDWDTAQTVTVTAVDDDFATDIDGGATISHTATSNDTVYDGFSIDDVTVDPPIGFKCRFESSRAVQNLRYMEQSSKRLSSYE